MVHCWISIIMDNPWCEVLQSLELFNGYDRIDRYDHGWQGWWYPPVPLRYLHIPVHPATLGTPRTGRTTATPHGGRSTAVVTLSPRVARSVPASLAACEPPTAHPSYVVDPPYRTDSLMPICNGDRCADMPYTCRTVLDSCYLYLF